MGPEAVFSQMQAQPGPPLSCSAPPLPPSASPFHLLCRECPMAPPPGQPSAGGWSLGSLLRPWEQRARDREPPPPLAFAAGTPLPRAPDVRGDPLGSRPLHPSTQASQRPGRHPPGCLPLARCPTRPRLELAAAPQAWALPAARPGIGHARRQTKLPASGHLQAGARAPEGPPLPPLGSCPQHPVSLKGTRLRSGPGSGSFLGLPLADAPIGSLG